MKRKLWNKDFLLLLQGKLVSNIGDVLYSVALSYWILETTGSKAMMGVILSVQTLVKVILSPFGGVVSDRLNRKQIIVCSDFICGMTLVSISLMGVTGHLQVWMVLAAGIVMAVASAFFGPAVSAILPDLVEKEDLGKALSANQTTVTLVQIAGQSISGVLLGIFGPMMIFLGNGVSYFLSSLSEAFIQNPSQQYTQTKVTFFEDFKSGLKFVAEFKGLKIFMFVCCMINFFGNGAIVLMLPYFMETPALQGAAGYGIASACMTVGSLAAVMIYGFLKLDGKKRRNVFTASILIMTVGVVMSMVFKALAGMLIAMLVFGFGNGAVNIVFSEVMYEIIPDDKRGKVMGLISTLSMGLTPISMAVFSTLADVLGTYVMFCTGMSGVVAIGLALLGLKEPMQAIENKPSATKIAMESGC